MTKSNNGILYRAAFYPFLLGIYPVLFLWLANYYQVPAFAVSRTLFISEAIAVVTYAIVWIILRNGRKAAALSGLFLILFFFYGHILSLAQSIPFRAVGHHRYMIIFWLVLFAAGTFWIIKTRSDLKNFTWAVNLLCIFFVAITIVQLGYQWFRFSRLLNSSSQASSVKSTLPAKNSNPTLSNRDIYYILLDSYAREDELKDEYNFNNSAFITRLKDLGFVIPDCTLSNYTTTIPTMSSVFNLNYLDKMGYPGTLFSKENTFMDYAAILSPILKDNLVFKKMKAEGYQIITFKPYYNPIDLKDQSDIYYNFDSDTHKTDKTETLQFQSLFLNTTGLRPIREYLATYPKSLDNVPSPIRHFLDPENRLSFGPYYRWYEQSLYTFEQLKEIPQLPGKKFVYAHLFMVHRPFTFSPDGSYKLVTPQTEIPSDYTDAMQYTNIRLLEIIQAILKESTALPIIILESDHNLSGLYSNNRTKNLNAYFLPDGGSALVYPQITNVNTFRLIFSHYFGEDYPFLPDVSYRIGKEYPNGYQIIPPSCAH